MRILLSFLFINLIICSFGQQMINSGKKVHIDGVIEKGEWCDSKIYLFDETEIVNTKVYLKHDGEKLLLAYIFEDLTDTNEFVMPEFFIDTKLNKGEQWQSDDYWFHVSAQDCYAVGKREDYTHCRADFLLWRASPNWPFDGQKFERINAIEISVPFQLLGIEAGQTIGLCLSQVIFPGDIRKNIPAEAHEDKPSTWKEFVIEQKSSDSIPELFEPGLISNPERWEVSISFLPDESEVFYTVKYSEKDMQIFSRKRIDNEWSDEYEMDLLIDKENSYAMEPFPSNDGNKLFYTLCDSLGCDIWFVQKVRNKWVNPTKLDSDLNKDVVFYSTFTQNGDMYYTNVSKRKTFMAELNNGNYNKISEAGFGGAHAFPSPDGSFVVVNSKGEYGRSDIFVYFKNDDNSWSVPINLGRNVNTGCSESCPSISPDGRYLFFNRHCYNDQDDYDIYRVSIKVIENLKPVD